MLLIISPAKKLDESPANREIPATQPEFLNDTKILIGELRKLDEKKLATLMSVSAKIAKLNVGRYKSFRTPFTADNARQALLCFTGDVYQHIDTAHYKAADFGFAQKHLRILSGLYGLLRPLDLMQPYRLEMGTAFKNPKGKDLYTFWGDRITKALNHALEESGSDTILNLASQEYFAAVKPRAVAGRIITAQFKEKKGKDYKIVGLLAKRARGMMADHVIKQRLNRPEDIKKFTGGGYRFTPGLSSEQEWVFTR